MSNVSVKTTIDDRSAAFTKIATENLKNALHAMADSILIDSRNLAPELTGALKTSGQIKKGPNGFIVEYGDSRVKYARRRHFENKKNPQTLLYLQRAGESVAKRGIKPYL